MNKCEGNREEHFCNGEVRAYHVTDPSSDHIKDWGRYNYCDNAAQLDRDNGFTVTLDGEKDDQQNRNSYAPK